jgi:hypothetical protein
MSNLSSIAVPKIDSLTLAVSEADGLVLTGTIASRDPNPTIGAYFKKVHEQLLATKPGKFTVDLTGLTFVNSSAVRLFIDWAMWIGQAGKTPPYKLHFRIARSITWQQTNFTALQSLAPNVIEIESK